MVRGSLVTLIFEKTLRMSTSAVADASAITLMSTDVERIGTGLVDMHETYANATEVVLALWLLTRLLHIAVISSTVFCFGRYCRFYSAMDVVLTFSIESMSDCRDSTRDCMWQRPRNLARSRRRTCFRDFEDSWSHEEHQDDRLRRYRRE